MSSKRTRFLFSCGCKDSKAVSVSASHSETSEKSAATVKDPPSAADARIATATTETFPSSSFYEDEDDDAASSSAASVSDLLRQLSELEKNVIEWAPPIHEEKEAEEEQANGPRRRRQQEYVQGHVHRRCRSEGRVEESVAVVKESEDPLSDFRKSMLQMIVEKEIVGSEELRELLRRFLELNSPRYHDLILRAFAEIWNEVFSGYENTPDLLRRSRSSYYYLPRR